MPKIEIDMTNKKSDKLLEAIKESEYSVTVTASFSVMAESQEDADMYILHQFYNGNSSYTDSVEVESKYVSSVTTAEEKGAE